MSGRDKLDINEQQAESVGISDWIELRQIGKQQSQPFYNPEPRFHRI